ncbi:MAG: type VI secretion system tube protein Hcp [Candidatus Woesearchaeota archaeon]|nr:type VI secretion system tube protein Hcp [Candidatus Woesearchaeota archaeon]
MKLLAIFLLACMLVMPAYGAAYLKIGDIKGEAAASGHENWITLDSFSFGVEREMKESGEKGGTADINIGIGELQEITVSKPLDASSPLLAQAAASGNSLGTAEIEFVETGGADGKPAVYLKYKLDRVFVKSWSISGDADDRPTEEVSFYYNKIAFEYQGAGDKKSTSTAHFGWDNVKNKKWESR